MQQKSTHDTLVTVPSQQVGHSESRAGHRDQPHFDNFSMPLLPQFHNGSPDMFRGDHINNSSGIDSFHQNQINTSSPNPNLSQVKTLPTSQSQIQQRHDNLRGNPNAKNMKDFKNLS